MRPDVPIVEIPVSLHSTWSPVQFNMREIDQVNELLNGLGVGCLPLIDWSKVTLRQWTHASECAILVRAVRQLDRHLFAVCPVPKVPGSVTPKDLTFLHTDMISNVQQMCNRFC